MLLTQNVHLIARRLVLSVFEAAAGPDRWPGGVEVGEFATLPRPKYLFSIACLVLVSTSVAFFSFIFHAAGKV